MNINKYRQLVFGKEQSQFNGGRIMILTMVLKLLDLYKKINLNLVGLVTLACNISSWEVKEDQTIERSCLATLGYESISGN